MLPFWTDTCPDGRLTENVFTYISVNYNPNSNPNSKGAVHKGRPWASAAGGRGPVA